MYYALLPDNKLLVPVIVPNVRYVLEALVGRLRNTSIGYVWTVRTTILLQYTQIHREKQCPATSLPQDA